MISKHLTILPVVAALLLSTGCSNDDMDGVLADGPVAAQVTAAISDGQTVTRVSTDGDTPSFADGDVINVVASETETNQYTLSSGTWSADTPYYFQDLNAVYFRGWYATSTPTDNTISINTTSQETNDSGWNEWDILAAPEVTAYAASPTINFTGDNAFSHVMSQVTLTFKAGNGVSNLENLTGYTLTDLTTDASFNTLTCELTAGSTTGDITQDIEASGTEYTCPSVILVPQDVTDGKLSLEVTFNGLTYTADLTLPESATAMTAGTHYAYNVNINNTGLTVNSAAIADWTTTDTESGSATIPITEGYTFTTDDNGIRSYTVYSEAGLLAWAEYTRAGNWGTNCTLGADITLTAVTTEEESNWTAVGNRSNEYTGIFDGNGYTISGLTIAGSGYCLCLGLIGELGSGGVVQNLTIADVSISATYGYYIGAVVGVNYGTVTGCCYASGTVNGYYSTGGVIGFNEGGTVTSCFATGNVTSSYCAGGALGINDCGTVTNCFATGNVSGTCVGGVVGGNYSTAGNDGIITACYSTGTVSGDNYIGGVVGENNGTVTACYFAGAMNSTDYIGGVVGNDDSGTITANYWYNSNATYGIASSNSNDGATYVDGTIDAWASAAQTMNGYLTDWQYVANDAYDGTDTTIAPLLLEEVTE